MQKDICYNVEKMHEPFPFTQDNQWDDSYFCKGENALPGSLIKSNQTETKNNKIILPSIFKVCFSEKITNEMQR